MKQSLFLLMTTVLLAQTPSLVRDVRAALNANDFARAQQLLAEAKQKDGVTSQYLNALSWVGRAKLAARDYDGAGRNAAETYSLAQGLLKQRKLDADTALPLALGAAIEVHSQALNAQGQKTEAVTYLRDELDKYAGTSIVTRLRKNLLLISLEGKHSPVLDVSQYLGARPKPLAQLKGQPVLLFFWAHWCGDCKAQAPILARLATEYAGRVAFVGPTRHYGYVAQGREAGAEEETSYIDKIRGQFYGSITGLSVPLVDDNLVTWGASTTPTLALLDKTGVVRLYHPGNMTYEELKAQLDPLLAR
jgi:thiol-disulfide isomerase/thioredoxin